MLAKVYRRRLTVSLLIGLSLLGGLAVAGAMFGGMPLRHGPDTKIEHKVLSPLKEEAARYVKVVRPKREAKAVSLEQTAMVEPYFRADLRARAAGIVKAVHGDIGDRVRRGDILVEIDVAELEQDIAQKESLVLQKERELNVSRAKVKDAQAGREVAAATIKQRQAEVQAVAATRDLKKAKLQRYKDLAGRGTVVGALVEEEERDYTASESAVAAAQANVERAIADLAEAASKVEAAAADVELKMAQIEVAKNDLDRAKVVAGFGKVLAPFDGVIVQRNVDPGSFVQNATAGVSETLVAIARVDLVTVVAKFTDAAAPLITVNTPATVQIDDLPNVTIPCKVTRYSPSIQNSDRTMRVEIDLFNGTDSEYESLSAMLRSAEERPPPLKSSATTIPERAFTSNSDGRKRLLPGMTGTIKLSVGEFGDSFALPSTAVYSRSGVSYLLVVLDGVTKQLPIRVQVTDGRTSRVSIVAKRKDADGISREVLMDLTGDEEVVVARQLEIGEGVSVRPEHTDW